MPTSEPMPSPPLFHTLLSKTVTGRTFLSCRPPVVIVLDMETGWEEEVIVGQGLKDAIIK